MDELQLIIKQASSFSQSSFQFPSYIHLHQFTFISSDSNSTNQINYNEGYTVTLRTSNINDRIIQASIIESTHFRREEAYIVKYVDPIEQPVIDYDSNPCKSFSFPYCVLQNYDDSDHYSFSYSIFYQSGYVIYIDINELDVPLNYLNSTLIDSVLLSLHNNETDVFTCTTYSNRLLNGCLIARQSLIREIITKTTISKGKLDVLDYIPLYFKEMNRELKVESMMIRESLSPYLNVKDKLIPTIFGCDLSENDTSFTVSVTTYRRPKMNMVFDAFDKQDLQPKQVVMIQNTDLLNWNSSLFANRKTTYYHIWCSNWNSRFVGKYHPGMMVDTTFFFVIDDDRFIEDYGGFRVLVNKLKTVDTIFGNGCAYGRRIPEGAKHPLVCDHTAWLIYARVKHYKIMFRGDLFTYSGGEDVELCVINYLSCGFSTKHLRTNLRTSTRDEYKSDGSFHYNQSISYKNTNIPDRSLLYIGKGLGSIYGYYKKHGYYYYYDRNTTNEGVF